MKRKRSYLWGCAIGLSVLWSSGPSAADTTFLASSGSTLYRATDTGGLEIFELPDAGLLRALHRNPITGEVLAIADGNGSSAVTVYTVENPFAGTPTLVEFTQLSQLYGSLTQIDHTYYAFSRGDLYSLGLADPANPVEKYVGYTGVAGTAGSGFDPATRTLYMMSNVTDRLYTVDPATAAVSPIGTGLSVDLSNAGAEWFDGHFYAAAHNSVSGDFEIGEIDVESGIYAPLITLIADSDPISVGLTVVPEPAGLFLLLAGIGVWIRRR